MSKPVLTLRNIVKRFGAFTALKGVHLQVNEGEFVTLLGPSGCGKSTLLRMVAGFEEPDEGEIELGSVSMNGVSPNHRPLTMMFQSLALFPHMTVGHNVEYGLRVRGMKATERRGRATDALKLVGLEDLADRQISQLSGGQRQRVALARALVIEPRILLLDEPLSALDLQLRRQLQLELKVIQRKVGCSFIFVTHDQEEAMTLSDRIVVMNHGVIEQIGVPTEVYSSPRTSFVATFLGDINMIPVRRSGASLLTESGAQIQVGPDMLPSFTQGKLAVRPESFSLDPESSQLSSLRTEGTVEEITQVGSIVRCKVAADMGALTATVLAGSAAARRLELGRKVILACPPAAITFLAD